MTGHETELQDGLRAVDQGSEPERALGRAGAGLRPATTEGYLS
ncbi:hypothetical protein Q31a_38040 [Aureliella helgolandensis]|uniref:Uncharacterized protein n=1 Tax=Aureliella helgolandensis TaxID=2527968 RepID=A0A518GA55_9BACT|nr:hypothetical protein Q31a_38040 [Aureliella helgolandensis]